MQKNIVVECPGQKIKIKESDIEIILDEADHQSEQILIRLTHEELMEKIRNQSATDNVK